MFNRRFIITIIIAQFLNLSYCSPRIRDKIAKTRIDNINYQLTKSVFPEHYTLKISPHLKNNTFTGYVKILIHVKKPTDKITLHQRNLNIIKEKIYITTKNGLVTNIKDADRNGTLQQEFYTITFSEILKENIYYLYIPEFYGSISNLVEGFHQAHYTDEKGKLRRFAMTFFESVGARLAFPCFDEPFFKAKFKIYIVRPSNYHSLSNSKLIKSIKLNNSLYEDEFEETVAMSTYLVAFVISDMKLLTNADRSSFRIIARPEVLNKGYEKNSFKLSLQILQALENYLNVNYTINKMDQVVVLDDCLEVNGMENWGLITYKESFYLITPQTSTKQKVKLALVIAHEFAHQWFGNLVTMDWWKYLWLKEGFAQFFQSKILDKIKPEWKLMEKYVAIEKHEVLEKDRLEIHRDMNQDAGTPFEIECLYDHVSYGKAGCIIQMLEAIMTPNVFRRGLTNYLEDRAFRSATPIDLYRNLQKSMDNSEIKILQNLNIEKIMNTWTSQTGHPLVYVERDYNKSQEVVKLAQSRHYYDKDESNSSILTNWYIPINYATKRNPNFKDTGFNNWLLKSNETITISNLKRDDWLILNKQEAYYYRVNYDVRNWKLIAKALKKNYRNIHVLNRAQLIDDSFNLAKLEKIEFSIPLDISSYIHQEDYYIIHIVFLRNIPDVEKYVIGTNVEKKFQNFVIQSLKRSYQRLGTNPRSADTQIDKLHRIEVVKWMCKFDYSQCRANIWKSFDEWRKNNKPLDLDLKTEILCNAVRYGSEDDWNYLLQKYKSTDDFDDGAELFEALACSENVSILENLIEYSLNKSEKFSIRSVVYLITNYGFVGLNVSMHYVAKHWNTLLSMYRDDYFEDLLGIIMSRFPTQTQFAKGMKLLPKNITEYPKMKLALQQIRLGISEKQKRMQQVSKFFRSYNPPNSPDQHRSNGNLCIPNIFSFILYALIIFVLFICNNNNNNNNNNYYYY